MPKTGTEPARTELIPFTVLPGILETTAPPWLASAYLVADVGLGPTFTTPEGGYTVDLESAILEPPLLAHGRIRTCGYRLTPFDTLEIALSLNVQPLRHMCS